MNRKRWMILAVCMLVLLSLAACGKADGGDDSGAAALKSTLQQVRDKLDEAKRDKAESDSTADDSVPEPEKTPEPTPEPSAATEPEQAAVEKIELTRVPSGGDEYAVITGYDAAENTVWISFQRLALAALAERRSAFPYPLYQQPSRFSPESLLQTGDC